LTDFINRLLANLIFLFERLDWLSVVDIILVAAIFFAILLLLRGTQTVTLLRGVILVVTLLGLLTTLEVLPAFSWLVRATIPAILFAIPVIFAPEIRHALERLGRAGYIRTANKSTSQAQEVINDLVSAASRLSSRKHGALIILARLDSLGEYIQTGVQMNAIVSTELLLQIFYPNTPLHDGAVIISGQRLVAAACVLPLSASGVLAHSPDRQLGLRHRAALGISEVSDAVAVVVSEETGAISVVQGGKMFRRLDSERLGNILRAFFKPPPIGGWLNSLRRIFVSRNHQERES
jgi:diadenylate cyclase